MLSLFDLVCCCDRVVSLVDEDLVLGSLFVKSRYSRRFHDSGSWVMLAFQMARVSHCPTTTLHIGHAVVDAGFQCSVVSVSRMMLASGGDGFLRIERSHIYRV